jgi:hypothetical protein
MKHQPKRKQSGNARPQTPPALKQQYRVRNWSTYSAALVRRGSLTLWFDEATIRSWHNQTRSGTRGAPQIYTDVAIECMAMLQAVYALPLRATQGLLSSLIDLLHLSLPVPHYTTLSRRRRRLTVALPRHRQHEHLHLVVDATGLKVYGEGEWQVRQHGWTKHRTWRKLHLGVDETTGEVLAAITTHKDKSDKELLPQLLAQVDEPIRQVSGDRGYDYMTCYQAIARRGARATIPPRSNAVAWNNGQMNARDANVRRIQELGGGEDGRAAWKRECGYHRRSLVETAICRLKTIFGDRLSAQTLTGQAAEARVRCAALNRMTALGMPDSYRARR